MRSCHTNDFDGVEVPKIIDDLCELEILFYNGDCDAAYPHFARRADDQSDGGYGNPILGIDYKQMDRRETQSHDGCRYCVFQDGTDHVILTTDDLGHALRTLFASE